MKALPTLYKKTSTGALQFWSIGVEETNQGFTPVGNIITIYGQVGTDSPQKTEDLITKGKNVGKKNETTPLQQATLEAEAKWEKQKKKGYVESKEAAMAGKVDDLIEGGMTPMLAQSYAKHGEKIKFPCYAQPKLDGIRCIAIVNAGKCTLWTRTRKRINSVPHIVRELEEIYRKNGEDFVLDGELYNHELKSNFEQIVSLVRQEEPGEGYEKVQYHVYDMIDAGNFEERLYRLDKLLPFVNYEDDSVKAVYTKVITGEDKVMPFFEKALERGYEGAMLRNADGLYVTKRSYDLQKVKEFDDAEFEIIGVDEGRGKLAGHVGAFKCRTKDGVEFFAKMSGDTAMLKSYFEKHELWRGKMLTVQYQGLTGKEGVPRFPVGIAIRDYE